MDKIKGIRKRVGESAEYFEVEDDYRALQKIVDGHLETVILPNRIVLWCNEEGLINGLDLNLIMYIDNKAIHYIHGDVFFSSYDDDGSTTSLDNVQVDWIERNFRIAGVSKRDEKEYMVYGLICDQ